jgi:hypothetical protein
MSFACTVLLARTVGLGLLSSWLAGCQGATFRRFETPLGPAVELRCSDARSCEHQSALLSCARGTKSIFPVTNTLHVVTCSTQVAPAKNASLPASQRRELLAARKARASRSPKVYGDPLAERGSGSSVVRPTPTMLAAAQRVAALEQQSSAVLAAIREQLAAKCTAGGLDACLARLDLTAWSALPAWGYNPGRDLRTLNDRAKALLDLCKRRHPPACQRLGELAHLLEQGRAVHELSATGGLKSLLGHAIDADPVYRWRGPVLVSAVVDGLKKQQSPPRSWVRQWSVACQKGSPGACLLGATVGWRDSAGYDDEVQSEVTVPWRLAQRPAAEALALYCTQYSSVCAEALEWQYQANLIDAPNYCRGLQQSCEHNSGASACEKLAVAVISSTCEPPAGSTPSDLYQKACSLGSARACGALVQPSLDDGSPMLALAYSLQACQAEHGDGCQQLSEVFGRSRRYTTSSVGLGLLQHACDKGHQPACHDVHVSEYIQGKTDQARQSLFRLCVNAELVRACRTTAQLDWLGGRPAVAASLLERQCLGPSDDRDSCVELGALLAHQGQRSRALAILARECQRELPHRSRSTEQTEVCRLAQSIEAGTIPHSLSHIFLEPIDHGWYAID